MNSQVCIDANLALKMVLNEEDSDKAELFWDGLLERQRQVIAPFLLRFEVTSVIRNRVYRNLLTPEEGEDAFTSVHALHITFLNPANLHRTAWELARRFNRPNAYDSHYLALAQMQDCELWTADQRLYNAVRQELPWVKWLGDYRAS